jgi:hypothetical protein
MSLIQVKYRDNHEGLVDEVALNKLVLSNQIKQFYRPSESRWVDVDNDPIRVKSAGYNGEERRETNKPEKTEEPVSLISRLLRREVKEKPLSAQEWFEQGYSIMYTTGNCQEAIQAFTSSIKLAPADGRTYLNRGMAYERINNTQQAIADYGKAIELGPKDAKAYYVRGMLFWHMGAYVEATRDIKISAEFGYKPAKDFMNRESFKFQKILERRNARKYQRYVLSYDRDSPDRAEVIVEGELVRLVNFSLSGVYIVSEKFYAPGSAVSFSIDFKKPQGRIDLAGKVARVIEEEGKWGIAIDLTRTYEMATLREV